MTTSSSSVPVLGPVLYFTSTDGYSYDVDNRPIFNLDTNIRHINTSLVGIGYGEHASLAGGQLSPGRAVLLAPNGSVFYPTSSPSINSTENIVGLVIGATDTGLNRVIWSSKHLDLDVLGLTSISAGQPSGSYLVCSPGNNGIITTTTTPNLSLEYVVGRIKAGPYVEINTSADIISSNTAITVSSAVKDNHANMYGLSRFRNLLLYVDAGEAPVQYTKRTVYMSDYTSATGIVNPMNAQLSLDRALISSANLDTTVYGNTLDNKVVKEQYTQFLTKTGIDSVACGTATSSWAASVYSTTLPGNGSENYELQAFNGGINYATAVGGVDLFKSFTIDKYYQYDRTINTPTSGKVIATATVFNPQQSTGGVGGESGIIIVWDFFEYNLFSGLETFKHRIILNGDAAVQSLLSSSNIFPPALINI